MRIAWFTPFVKKSAIGMVSKDICEELVKGNDVDIWTPHKEDLIETDVDVISFGKKTEFRKLREYDCIIYNMGNYAGFHREILEISKQFPGVVILHDQTLAGFWGQYYTFEDFGGNSVTGYAGYFNLFKQYYGSVAEQEVRIAKEKGVFPIYDDDEVKKYSLIEPAIENCLGVYTHAHFFAKKIKSFYNGPVGYSYLPCEIHEQENVASKEIKKILDDAKKKRKTIIVSNGIVHPVKHIDIITDALREDKKLREKYVYIVVGSYGGEYGEKLKKLSDRELSGCLYMMGYQPDDVMNVAIAQADLCVNLRYPNSEVCSLSLLEQMSYGKPVLVIDSGIYGEMPDDTVIKLPYKDIKENAKKVLRDFTINKSKYADYGKCAKEFIERECTVTNYAQSLLEFIGNLEINRQVNNLQNRYISRMSNRLFELGITDAVSHNTVDSAVNAIKRLFNEDKQEKCTVNTIGVWAGFRYHVPNLHREGISRFIKYMISAYIERYEVDVEIWTYSFNQDEVETIFAELLDSKFDNHVKVITEQNWTHQAEVRGDLVERIGVVDEKKDNLSLAARHVSKAEIMIPMIVYLDNVVGTGKKIFVPAHDMSVAERYEDFLLSDKSWKFRSKDIVNRTENLVRNGAKLFCNCETVRDTQIVPFIENVKKEDVGVIYLPLNISADIDSHIIPEADIRKKFNIQGRYLFYPTQVRPYKNVILLMKALNELKKEYDDLKVVLTGNPEDLPEVSNYIKKNNLKNRVICVKSVSEYELYSLYKYAAATPVTSLFEGGFPWQACEAMYMKTPVVISNIPIVMERIKKCGFTIENCGVPLFDPKDSNALVKEIRKVMNNRKNAVSIQKKFAEKLLSYTWNDAAKEYYSFFHK